MALGAKYIQKSHLGTRFFELDRNNMTSSHRTWYEQVNGLRGQSVAFPGSLNIEYASQVPQPLKDTGYYLIRAGNGNSIVFDSSVFPAPFLKLYGMHWNAEEIFIKKRGYTHLKQAFRAQG
jgi:hypothetical protein